MSIYAGFPSPGKLSAAVMNVAVDCGISLKMMLSDVPDDRNTRVTKGEESYVSFGHLTRRTIGAYQIT